MMISKRVIDVKPYHSVEDVDVTWAQTTMRSWLNGFDASQNLAGEDFTNDSFIQKAFNETEREHIKLVTNTNPACEFDGVPGGADTKDRVFLLSYNEIKAFFPSDELRQAPTTEYTKHLKPYIGYAPEDCSGDDCKGNWLSRTPAKSLKRVIRVFTNGYICPSGANTYYDYFTYTNTIFNNTYTYLYYYPADHGVRPAIWVKK